MADLALFPLARVILALEVPEYFDIIKAESTNTEVHIYLDKKMHEDLRNDATLNPKSL